MDLVKPLSTMKKRSTTLSEKINQLFEPVNAKEQSEESGDETFPKLSEFDEIPDEAANTTALSEFRKRNFRFLEEIDRKYKGTVSSRKEERSGSDEDDKNESEKSSDFDEEDDHKSKAHSQKAKRKSLVFVKPNLGNEYSEATEDSGASDESSDDENHNTAAEQGESFTGYSAGEEKTTNEQITLIEQENHQETVSKGLAVQNQLKLWERMLEMRIKVQPCLITANSLPPADVYKKLQTSSQEFRDKADQTSNTVAEALDRLLALQETLFEQFSETEQLLKSGTKRRLSLKKAPKAKRIAVDVYEQSLAGRTNEMAEYRNSVLMKWHDRTKIASSLRNQKQSLSLLKRIEESLINSEDLIRKTQQYRGGYTLYGRPDLSKSKTIHDEEEQHEDVDPDDVTTQPIYDAEIYDDSDFYHQLLRELIEYKSNTIDSPQEIANKLAELQKLRNKMKKNVDTRASKGRKIRYVVHNKLVNYMAPVPDYDWTDDAKDELFGSLFGRMPSFDQL